MAWFDQRTLPVWSSAFRRLLKDLPQEERPRKRGTPNTPAPTSVGRATPSCLVRHEHFEPTVLDRRVLSGAGNDNAVRWRKGERLDHLFEICSERFEDRP